MSKVKVQTPMGEMKEATVIGPSNLGVLFGVNKYESTYEMWLRLTARKIRETNQFAQRGIDMERYIAIEYATRCMSQTQELRVNVPFKKHKTIECFGCYTDGDVFNIIPGDKPVDKDNVVYSHSCNIKTISSDFGAESFDDPLEWVGAKKPEWIYQAQGEMSIDGSPCHDIIVWPSPVAEYDDFLRKLVESGAFEDKSFRDKFFDAFPIMAVVTIPRDENLIAQLEKKVQDFWNNHILTDTPPEVSESETSKSHPVSDNKHEINDENIIKAVAWLKKNRESVEKVQTELWAMFDKIDAHTIIAGENKIFKNENVPRKYMSTNMLLAELPKRAIRQFIRVVNERRIDITDTGCMEMTEEQMREREEQITNAVIVASKGIDYSDCYTSSTPSNPYNYRFSTAKSGKSE